VSAEEEGESGVGAAGAPGEVVDGVESVFGGCCDDAGEHALGGGPDPGPVAAPCFAVDNTGSHRLFASEVGGVHALDGEEAEQGVGLVGEVFEQPSVGVAARRSGAQWCSPAGPDTRLCCLLRPQSFLELSWGHVAEGAV